MTVREKKGIGIGRGETEGTGKDGGPAVLTGTKTGGSVEEVAAAAETERVNVETKTETAGTTAAGGRKGITIKIEAPRGRGRERKRAGERLMTEGIKMTGRGTEKRGNLSGRAGVEAGKEGTKAAERRRAGKEIVATAGIESGRETESSAPTNGAAAKRGATISESRVTTIVDIVNADGARALIKCHLQKDFYSCSCVFPSSFLPAEGSVTSAHNKKKHRHVEWPKVLSTDVILLYVYFSAIFHSPFRPSLVFT